MYWQGTPVYTVGAFDLGSATNLDFRNLYVHGWSHASAQDSDVLTVIMGYGMNTGTVLEYSEIDGSDSGIKGSAPDGASGLVVNGVPVVHHCKIHDMVGAVNAGSGPNYLYSNEVYKINHSFVAAQTSTGLTALPTAPMTARPTQASRP